MTILSAPYFFICAMPGARFSLHTSITALMPFSRIDSGSPIARMTFIPFSRR